MIPRDPNSMNAAGASRGDFELSARQSNIRDKHMEPRIHKLARKIWDYHHLNHQLEKSDAILVLCSHDKSVAERGARR
jgi:hypothetical protein